MMLTPSLPMLPPPSSSLLPSLAPSDPAISHGHQHPHPHHPHHHRRQKHAPNPRSTLSMLSADERSIASRKLAIAMYGYSWLKPAGCSKTMLGRREEEIEREEVERQLREVEMQERMAVEAEEQERLARLQEGGEPEEGRDLDDDVPEPDESGDEDLGEGEEGMEGDLDDDIPDADEEQSDDEIDESRIGQGWVYDTNREPDSDEEVIAQRQAAIIPGSMPPRRRPALGSEYDVDERAAEELADEMLDEDEMAEMDFDQDDAMGDVGRDLDDDVPEADEGGWEHTDSELEDSEMDISILPGQTHLVAGARRSSGLPQARDYNNSGARVLSGNAAANLQTTRNFQGRILAQTPQFSSDMTDPESTVNHAQPESSSTRSWLQAASARRNLFGIGRNQPNAPSGRLFTPSPAQETPEDTLGAEDGQTPRRSGRFSGRRRGARASRDSVD